MSSFTYALFSGIVHSLLITNNYITFSYPADTSDRVQRTRNPRMTHYFGFGSNNSALTRFILPIVR